MMQRQTLIESLELARYPESSDKSLTAFNQAEVLLIESVLQHFNEQKISIINENFGAISCVLHSQVVDFYNDSFLSKQALLINSKQNDIHLSAIEKNELTQLCGEAIIGLIPKSLSFFDWQLSALAKLNKPVIFAGMVKYISKGHIDLMNYYFTDIKVSKAVKKARTIRLNQPKTDKTKFTNPTHSLQNIRVENLPGVFCQNHIDIGARFFIEQFNKLPIQENMKIADLGCGNGILSLALAHKFKKNALNLSLFDESSQAVKCAEHNWKLNQFDNLPHHAQFIQNNGLLNQGAKEFDLILCNPPFHQNHTVGTHISVALFKQAKQCLADNGEFWVVANRQLPYQKELKALFKQVHLVAQNSKFKVFRAC